MSILYAYLLLANQGKFKGLLRYHCIVFINFNNPINYENKILVLEGEKTKIFFF